MNRDQLIRHIAHRVKERKINPEIRKRRARLIKSVVPEVQKESLAHKSRYYSTRVDPDYIEVFDILYERYLAGEVTKTEFKQQIDILISKAKDSETQAALLDVSSITFGDYR